MAGRTHGSRTSPDQPPCILPCRPLDERAAALGRRMSNRPRLSGCCWNAARVWPTRTVMGRRSTRRRPASGFDPCWSKQMVALRLASPIGRARACRKGNDDEICVDCRCQRLRGVEPHGGPVRNQRSVHRQQLHLCGRLARAFLSGQYRHRSEQRRYRRRAGAVQVVHAAGGSRLRRVSRDARRQRPRLSSREQSAT